MNWRYNINGFVKMIKEKMNVAIDVASTFLHICVHYILNVNNVDIKSKSSQSVMACHKGEQHKYPSWFEPFVKIYNNMCVNFIDSCCTLNYVYLVKLLLCL